MLALYVDGEEVLCRKHSFPGMPPIGLQNVADLVRQLVADGYSTESAGVALWEGIAQPRLLVMQAAGEAIGDVAAWSLAAGILIEAAATAAPARDSHAPCPRLSPPRPLRVVTPAPREVGAYADTRWRRYSRAFRRRNPFCRFCDQRGSFLLDGGRPGKRS